MAQKWKDIRLHAVEILGALDRLRRSGTFCDVVLLVEGRPISAHRNVLAANSDYFAAMFTSNMEESHAEKITLHDVAYDAVCTVIEYIYTGKFEVEQQVALQEVIVVADLFRMEPLKQYAVDQLIGCMNGNNCIGLWFFADMYSCGKLHNRCQAVIRKRFVSVAMLSDEFLELEENALMQLLSIEGLSLGPDGEDSLVSVILRWLNDNPLLRKEALPRLLHSIHISHASASSLDKLQEHLPPDYFQEADKKGKDGSMRESSLDSIFLIGGYLQSRTGKKSPRLTQIHRYDLADHTWFRPTTSLPDAASLLYAFSAHGRLLCLIRNEGLFDLLEFDLSKERWAILSRDTVFSPAAHQAVDLYFTAAGGDQAYNEHTDELFLAVPEKIVAIKVKECDLDLLFFDTVKQPATIPNDVQDSRRHDFTLVMHQHVLYSLGGSRLYSASQVEGTSDVYCYDSASDCWREKACMLEHRAKLAASSLGDFLYVMGGFSTRRLSSSERYCPVTNQWTVLTGMRKQRTHALAVPAGGYIYIFGGKSYADNYQCGGARKVIKASGRYDPVTDSWEDIEPMPVSRCQYAAIAY